MGSPDARRIPSTPRGARPRRIPFPFPGLTAATASTHERFLIVVCGRTGTCISGRAHKRHRHLYDHGRGLERKAAQSDRQGTTSMSVMAPAPRLNHLDDYVFLLGSAEIDELRALAGKLQGRTVQMVNSTAMGGGVAEMLNRV